MRVFLNQTITNIKAFPGGLKKVFNETKYVYKIAYKKDIEKLKRRDAELVRTNFKAIKKLSAFIVIQAVPIVGYIPLIGAFQFPKQILTSHFWSEQQLDAFVNEDYLRGHTSSHHLISEQGVPFADRNIDAFIKNHGLYFPKDTLSLNNLTAADVDKLAAANVICSSDFTLKWSHGWILRRWLNRRARDVAFDDSKLLEEGLDDLTPTELRAAAVRRGINPSLSTDVIREFLTQWLESQELKLVREIIYSTTASEESRQHNTVLLLHTVAFNAIRTHQIEPKFIAVDNK